MDILIGILAVSSPLLLAILGAAGWLYRHERELREAAERQVSEHKYRAYIALIEIFFDLFKAGKGGRTISESKLLDRMIDANKELVLYASDDVLRIYLRWTQEAREGVVNLQRFGELILAIRRDMGHLATQITVDDVLRQFITDYGEAKAQGKLEQHPQESGPRT